MSIVYQKALNAHLCVTEAWFETPALTLYKAGFSIVMNKILFVRCKKPKKIKCKNITIFMSQFSCYK